MREERGAVAGPLVVHEPYTLWGTVGGTVTVVEGGKFYMRGSVLGDLNVEYGGRVHILGNVAGNLKVARGSKVIVDGIIAGDATNEGGRLYVNQGEVKGKVKALKGDTKVTPKPGSVLSDRPAETSPRRRRPDPDEPGRLELSGSSMPPPPELAAEAERVTKMLFGKPVARVWQNRAEAIGIEFADGTKIYIESTDDGIIYNVTGKLSDGVGNSTTIRPPL